MSILRKISNNEDNNSVATRLRRRRFSLFRQLVEKLPAPVRILDVGGTEIFWRQMGISENDAVHVTLLNISKAEVRQNNLASVSGDARKMDFSDKSFDIVFSNSVIEHLGTAADQRKMSDEIRRVGKRYFVQTPNKLFPIEPHFLFPCFQFLPLAARVWVASHYTAGWYCRPGDPVAAKKEVESIRLLSRQEFQELFPEGILYKEKFGGITKSFILYHGWNAAAEK